MNSLTIIFVEFFNFLTFATPFVAAYFTGDMNYMWFLFASAVFISHMKFKGNPKTKTGQKTGQKTKQKLNESVAAKYKQKTKLHVTDVQKNWLQNEKAKKEAKDKSKTGEK